MGALMERAKPTFLSIFNSPYNQLVRVVDAFARIELVNGGEWFPSAGFRPIVKQRALGNGADALYGYVG